MINNDEASQQPAPVANQQPSPVANQQPSQVPNPQPAQVPNPQPAQVPNPQPAPVPNQPVAFTAEAVGTALNLLLNDEQSPDYQVKILF